MTLMGNHAYWHFHQEIEIFYSAKGSGKCIVGDYVGRYSKGQLVMARSFLPHDFNYADDDDQTNNILIHFSPQVLNGFTEFASIRHLLEQARYGLSFKNIPEKTQLYYGVLKARSRQSERLVFWRCLPACARRIAARNGCHRSISLQRKWMTGAASVSIRSLSTSRKIRVVPLMWKRWRRFVICRHRLFVVGLSKFLNVVSSRI